MREGGNNLDTSMIIRIAAGVLAAGLGFFLIQRRRKQAK
jgi:LPXTG-motif cell wall-anchored protein